MDANHRAEREMIPITVAIVNYNTREDLRVCLASLDLDRPSEVIVVDNASTDASVQMVTADYPWVALYVNKRNIGYGAAANRAIAACTTEYAVLLNSDTIVPPGAIDALVSYLDDNPEVAIVGPRLTNPDGTLQRSCFSFPAPVDVFLDMSNLIRVVAYVPFFKEFFFRTWSHNQVRSVPWLCGAVLVIRRSAFGAVRGFDKSFFMYFEEVDLCYRLAHVGWKIHFAPVAQVIHTGGKSTQQHRADMTVQFFVSLAHFYRRHYSKLYLLELFALVECVALCRLLRDLIALAFSKHRQRHKLLSNVSAWCRLLVGHWWKQAAASD